MSKPTKFCFQDTLRLVSFKFGGFLFPSRQVHVHSQPWKHWIVWRQNQAIAGFVLNNFLERFYITGNHLRLIFFKNIFTKIDTHQSCFPLNLVKFFTSFWQNLPRRLLICLLVATTNVCMLNFEHTGHQRRI